MALHAWAARALSSIDLDPAVQGEEASRGSLRGAAFLSHQIRIVPVCRAQPPGLDPLARADGTRGGARGVWAVDPQSSTSTSTTRLPSYSALQLSAVHLTFASLFGGVIMHHISIAVSVVGSPAGRPARRDRHACGPSRRLSIISRRPAAWRWAATVQRHMQTTCHQRHAHYART